MSPVFSPDIIARVKDETDILEMVGRYVQLKAAGSVHKGLCPFHKEKTPSFIVTPARQRYHCFGCGTGGDVFTFLMEMEQLSFPEAVETLARPLDIDLSEWLREDEGEGERRAFHRANEAAMDIWRDTLWEDGPGRAARTYLRDRGFGDKVLRDFDVGVAPPGGGWLAPRLDKAGVDEELALAADLLRRGERDGTFAYFRGRIIFPIRSISRQVVGFGGRVIDRGEPKYLNSADSTYFTKGKLLYGFDASRMAIAREKTALLVEGYLDLLALVQAGFTNVVATCGTAFTPDQARLLRRGAPRVTLLFDGDKAGVKAAVRSSDTALKCGLDPRIASLPKGEDPASLLESGGAAAMQEVLAADMGYVPFLKSLADGRGGGREVAERAVRQALGTASGVTDPLRREYLLQETGEVFGLSREVLTATLVGMKEKLRPRVVAAEAAGDEATEGEPAPEPPRRSKVFQFQRLDVGRLEKDLFLHVLRDDTGGAARAFLAGCGDLEFAGETSRLLADEVAAWAKATDGGQRILPRDFVEQRWNQQGDAGYRNFVSRLLNEEDCPTHTDFVQVVNDLIRRLAAHRQRARGG
ncbi:MAG: DNA primase [bacterium]|nr:DNA primase [bacterium]